jgi:hypothetical protein
MAARGSSERRSSATARTHRNGSGGRKGCAQEDLLADGGRRHVDAEHCIRPAFRPGGPQRGEPFWISGPVAIALVQHPLRRQQVAGPRIVGQAAGDAETQQARGPRFHQFPRAACGVGGAGAGTAHHGRRACRGGRGLDDPALAMYAAEYAQQKKDPAFRSRRAGTIDRKAEPVRTGPWVPDQPFFSSVSPSP